MAATQYNKYIWLVDTIRSAGKITKAEIDRRWLHANLNEYHESRIPDRTFFRCLNEIEMLFDIEIKCLRSLPLHHSQKEVEPCVFEWFVAPTLDFIQQLRTYGSELEILQPQSLREQFKAELKKQLALYK